MIALVENAASAAIALIEFPQSAHSATFNHPKIYQPITARSPVPDAMLGGFPITNGGCRWGGSWALAFEYPAERHRQFLEVVPSSFLPSDVKQRER